MRKFYDTLFSLLPWVCVVTGIAFAFTGNFEKATHSYVTTLLLWKMREL